MTIKQAFEKLTAVTAAAMKNPFFVMRKLHDAFADIADKIEGGGGGGSTVEVEAIQTTGTKIATISVDDVDTDLYAPAASAIFIDTSNVIKDDFTMDAEFHTWEASANCVLTGNCDAPDSSTSWVIQINDNQVGAGYQVICPFIYVKAGQTVKYRVKSTSALKAYGLQS